MSPDSSNFTPTVPAKKNNHKFVMPGITAEAQDFTAELLERNHEKFNIFFNDRGFHKYVKKKVRVDENDDVNGRYCLATLSITS